MSETTSHTAAVVERVARAIRTARLNAIGASSVARVFSPDAPAEDADLESARAALDASGHAEMIAALKAARAAILSPLNRESIVCTVWHSDGETLVDYIDAALAGRAEEVTP